MPISEARHAGLVHALKMVMQAICEADYSASWLIDWEYTLWERIQEPRPTVRTDEAIAEWDALTALSETIDGWLRWDEERGDVAYISRADWERHLAERAGNAG